MKTTNPNIEHDAPPYGEYKEGLFETTKRRISNTLNGISQTSLKDKDKKKLINEIKTIVKNF